MPETAIKERPILFSGEMVRAILAGQKSQTRRVVKPQPIRQHHIGYVSDRRQWCVLTNHASVVSHLPCPYGKPGDRLWVRETFRAWCHSDPHIEYKADGSVAFEGDDRCYLASAVTEGRRAELALDGIRTPEPWRPSIHMPRWASRILLEVTDVRVERVQAISEEDAKAEGVDCVANFRTLWGNLNQVRGHGWDTNPWVWVVSFKRIESEAPHA